MQRDSHSTIELTLPTVEATQKLGHILGRSLPAGSVVLLNGDLGSGKTTLVNAIGKGLGIEDIIISPTFVLVNEYDRGRLPLYHFDLYRLNASQARALIIEQYWDEAEYEPGIVAIEWADRLGDRPPSALAIQLGIPTSGAQLSVTAETDPPYHEATESVHQRTAVITLKGDVAPDMDRCWQQIEQLEQVGQPEISANQ
ncbi:MAG: tRNA (adenosine(37)-N6)-threonylcarbamoyltransferase complex ATPase subunit type 1 TsaE [Cyanobacteria bacterium P01_E01_bin.6]